MGGAMRGRMRVASRVYSSLLHAMAGLAGLTMVVMMFSIVTDVVLRGAGGQSSAHIFTFNEYFLFVIPFLGGPLLVREKGHVCVEALLMQFSPAVRGWLVRFALVLCIVTCAVLAWYAGDLALTDYVRDELDVRSLDMPRWMLIVFMPLSLAMMAIEFTRFLIRGESPNAGADENAASY